MAEQKPKAKYQPHFHGEIPPLPATKKFQLNYILHNELAGESQQVVDSLTNVAANYRADLKKEIRKKLSIEQKLQYKNIDVAKRTNALEKIIAQENRRIAKVLSGGNGKPTAQEPHMLDRNNSVDDDVLSLVDLTDSLSEQAMALTRKLAAIDAVVSKKSGHSHLAQYPLVHSYLTKKRTAADSKLATPVGEAAAAKRSPEPKSVREVAKKSPVQHSNENVSPAATYRHMFEPIHEEINPKDFEAFMANTLTKYRKLQLDKFNNLDIFLTPDDSIKFDNLELFNSPDYDNSLTSSYHTSENPISLLYTKPSIKSMNTEDNSTVAAKSPAIVTQNLQTSHFKKLRINGAPITSETFRKQQQQDGGDGGGASVGAEEVLIVKDDIESDTFDSSGLNTDSDDDEEPISSHSSDDSSSSEPEITGGAGHYYKTLKKSIQQKHRKAAPKTYTQETSPTPKHQPSHHTLKPKGSILKISGQAATIRRAPSKKAAKKGLRYTQSSTMLSVNGAGADIDVESVTASGIILPPEITDAESAVSEYEDNEVRRWDGLHETPEPESIRSLSKLRRLIH